MQQAGGPRQLAVHVGGLARELDRAGELGRAGPVAERGGVDLVSLDRPADEAKARVGKGAADPRQHLERQVGPLPARERADDDHGAPDRRFGGRREVDPRLHHLDPPAEPQVLGDRVREREHQRRPPGGTAHQPPHPRAGEEIVVLEGQWRGHPRRRGGEQRSHPPGHHEVGIEVAGQAAQFAGMAAQGERGPRRGGPKPQAPRRQRKHAHARGAGRPASGPSGQARQRSPGSAETNSTSRRSAPPPAEE